ncbi:MAG: DUF2069 domain-containing protein [Gammaproteobacteria bacterium]|nr:DUF2069 domain-containing protein [Gammaproteobacteria bacterium]
MNPAAAAPARRATLAAWALLGLALLAWPFVVPRAAAVVPHTAFALLLLPLRGFWRGTIRTLRWAPLTLVPALLIALTEAIANPPARRPAGLVLALLLVALTADLAWLRVATRRA